RGRARDREGGRRAVTLRLRKWEMEDRKWVRDAWHARNASRTHFLFSISYFRSFVLALIVALPLLAQEAPERLDRGRFVFLFFPRDRQLATSLAAHAVATDTFPGLPRPKQRAIVAIAP